MSDELIKLDDLVTEDDSFEEIKRVGIVYQRKTVESILAFSKVVYVLKQKCEKDQDNDFGLKAMEFFGLAASSASQIAKTGEYANKFIGYANSLPASARTLYELTHLSLIQLDKHINEGDINPNSTVNDIKAIKDTIKEEKKSKKKEETSHENPFQVEAEDAEGNAISATLEPNEDNEQENSKVPTKPKENKKLSVVEALAIFDIDMNILYMEHLAAGKDKDLLDKAFFAITGEKL